MNNEAIKFIISRIVARAFDAQKEYESILAKDDSVADAYYGLGNIYEKLGDTAKARSEWRKTLKVQINHSGAINKLGL